MLYLKWTAPGRVPSYQGGDPLPEPGVWTPTIPDPILCKRGWHACRWEDAAAHIAAELWVCELDGRIVEGPDKVAAERLRLVERVPLDDQVLRHFAADCAERVLPLFEAKFPGDDRPRMAIQAARDFADGKITPAAASAAASAASAAVRVAASAAARVAACAARDAASAAVRDAACAARDAASAAARDAACAARYAAWAAGDAAGDAAWAAAGAAAGAAQSNDLLPRLGLDPADYAHRSNP